MNDTNAPQHERARLVRPRLILTTAADRSARHFGRFRSSCGHILGFAWVRNGRQWVVTWAACRS